jgi:hypothetical protein
MHDDAPRVQRGEMLWFDEKKDFGFILTDEGERLYVHRSGFAPGQAPVGRCAHLPVELTAVEQEGNRIATDVTMLEVDDVRRARRRRQSYRSS